MSVYTGLKEEKMTREDKQVVIASLKEKFENSSFFYLTDFNGMTVEETNNFRRKCFESGIEYTVAKNTLIRKALEQIEGESYEGIYDALKGQTSVMFTEVSNAPAKLLKDFHKKVDKPALKAAYIDSDVYMGAESLEALAALKSKAELIGEVIGLLQSPAKNVVSALQSGGNIISGLLKTMEERGE